MRWILATACVVMASWFLPGQASADDFRMENQVFVPGEKAPVSRSTTIFHEGVVYDYLEGDPEVTILDKDATVFTILDTARRLRTELTTNEIRMLAERLGNLAATSDDPAIRFFAQPKFDEVYDAASGRLRLQSEWLEYRLVTQHAPGAEMAGQYRRYLDLCAQLNTARNLGSRPPQARMLVNAALERLQLLPCEVSLAMPTRRGPGSKTIAARSEHQLGMGLSGADVNRVKQTREYMTIFTQVSFEEYQQHTP